MVKDTSKDYDDLVGYKAEENQATDLSDFLDIESDNKPKIRPKPVDPEFPEEWQDLYVNFLCQEDYINFMKLIGEIPGPKIKTVVFQKEKDDGLLAFFED